MKKLLIGILLMVAAMTGMAQEDTLRKTIDEVVITANKFEMLRRDVLQRIDIVNRRDLQWMNSMNTADLLSNTGNILVQKSQGGGGSPIIRGFESNKVLIMVDGVRMNNAIFRGGHLQNVLRIDNAVLEKVEILYGPSSAMYGSDALGGVMHFITKKPVLNQKIGGSAMLRYSTATGEKTGHLDINAGGKKVASLTSLTWSDFGDIVQGGRRKSAYPNFGARPFYVERIGGKDSMVVNPNPDKQVGTAYRQYDLMEKVLFQQNEKTSHLVNLQYSNTGNVTRYDRLTETDSKGIAKNAEWYYGPEQRLLASYRFDRKMNTALMDKFSLTLAYQNNKESRNSRKFNSSKLKSQNEQIGIASFDMDGYKQFKRQEINYGAEAYFNSVTSTAFFTNVNTLEESPADTRYPDGSNTMNIFAVYAQDKISLVEDKLFFNAGVRYNYSRLKSTFATTTFFAFPFDAVEQNSGSFSGNAGLLFLPTADTRLSLIASRGFRTPNIDDLTKVFESVAGRLIIPNPDLKPEYTTNFELGMVQTVGGKAKIEAGGFYTLIDHAIVTDVDRYNGQDSVLYGGVMSKVYSSQNKRKAYIAGAYGTAGVDLWGGFSVTGTINYTYGRIREESGDTPLDHIPPVFGKAAVQYRSNRLQGELSFLFNGKKDISDYLLNAEDNELYATADGMPAWNTLNIRLACQVHKYLNIQLACENILDTNYRVFASGVSAPGRNFRITLRTAF
jgi:hemoglobin/transferrin/lactoferrin receptor protein